MSLDENSRNESFSLDRADRLEKRLEEIEGRIGLYRSLFIGTSAGLAVLLTAAGFFITPLFEDASNVVRLTGEISDLESEVDQIPETLQSFEEQYIENIETLNSQFTQHVSDLESRERSILSSINELFDQRQRDLSIVALNRMAERLTETPLDLLQVRRLEILNDAGKRMLHLHVDSDGGAIEAYNPTSDSIQSFFGINVDGNGYIQLNHNGAETIRLTSGDFGASISAFEVDGSRSAQIGFHGSGDDHGLYLLDETGDQVLAQLTQNSVQFFRENGSSLLQIQPEERDMLEMFDPNGTSVLSIGRTNLGGQVRVSSVGEGNRRHTIGVLGTSTTGDGGLWLYDNEGYDRARLNATDEDGSLSLYDDGFPSFTLRSTSEGSNITVWDRSNGGNVSMSIDPNSLVIEGENSNGSDLMETIPFR